MRIVEFLDNNNKIYNVSYELDKDKFTIRWKWPKDIGIVYILKTNSLDDFQVDSVNESNVKLYTREEYKEFNGYCEAVKEISQYRYVIFPAVENEDDGICFDFINNIPTGTSIMPEITVGKDEYIKVFIKDINKYGNAYSLKQE